MTPLTKDQAAALDAMAASAMHSVEEAVGIANEAGNLAERLRAHGINASGREHGCDEIRYVRRCHSDGNASGDRTFEA